MTNGLWSVNNSTLCSVQVRYDMKSSSIWKKSKCSSFPCWLIGWMRTFNVAFYRLTIEVVDPNWQWSPNLIKSQRGCINTRTPKGLLPLIQLVRRGHKVRDGWWIHQSIRPLMMAYEIVVAEAFRDVIRFRCYGSPPNWVHKAVKCNFAMLKWWI